MSRFLAQGVTGERDLGGTDGRGRSLLVSGAGQAGSVKDTAKKGFRRLRLATGLMLSASSAVGVFLLATDNSLWLLAVSHAVGLIIIVAMDVVLGLYSLASAKPVYLQSIAAGALGFVLQAGDVFTGPQYHQTVFNFARYLFGVWPFDLLLVLQGGIVVAGVLGRPHARYLSRRRTRAGTRLDYSRRGFLKSLATFTGLAGAGVALSSMKLPTFGGQQVTTGTVGGPVANVKDLRTGVPVYFEYPS
ncbi:MAG: hypothetical protein JRN29_05825, partial [Nitrososphaerota archaeon]|nr:hypothetical protein [Nitrososphaerota archaeon]